MTEYHPITPPPKVYGQWYDESPYDDELGLVEHVATQAARWGADQELEACCEWIVNCKEPFDELDLHNARRPKPPSLKEQAFQALCRFQAAEGHKSCTEEEIVMTSTLSASHWRPSMTNPYPYYAMCEQLMELVEGKRYDGSAVVARARALLGQLEPEVPTTNG